MAKRDWSHGAHILPAADRPPLLLRQAFETAKGNRLQVIKKKLMAVPSNNIVDNDALFHMVFLPDSMGEGDQHKQLNIDGSLGDPKVCKATRELADFLFLSGR